MKKVVIIGAGPAGLTAAYELVCQIHSTKVFFETYSVGGRKPQP